MSKLEIKEPSFGFKLGASIVASSVMGSLLISRFKICKSSEYLIRKRMFYGKILVGRRGFVWPFQLSRVVDVHLPLMRFEWSKREFPVESAEVCVVDFEKNSEGFLKLSNRLLDYEDKIMDQEEMEEFIENSLKKLRIDLSEEIIKAELNKELNEKGLELTFINLRNEPSIEFIEMMSREDVNELMDKNVKLNLMIEMAPHDPNVYMNRGKFYMNQCQFYDKAIEDFSNSIHLYPNNSYAHLYRAIALYNMGLNSQSLQDFEKCTKLELYDTSMIREANLYISLLKNPSLKKRYPKLEEKKNGTKW